MADYTILHGCVQGLPSTLTLVGSTVVPLASSITNRVAGGYYYQGSVVADTLLGNAGVITRLLSFFAIAAV